MDLTVVAERSGVLERPRESVATSHRARGEVVARSLVEPDGMNGLAGVRPMYFTASGDRDLIGNESEVKDLNLSGVRFCRWGKRKRHHACQKDKLQIRYYGCHNAPRR